MSFLTIATSTMHTLLLTLSAWGRSLVGGHDATAHPAQFTDTEFHFSMTAPKGWSVNTRPVMYPALRVGFAPNGVDNASSPTYIKVAAGKLQLASLEAYIRSSLGFYKEMWTVESTRDFSFLGAPAKDMLLRQDLGNGSPTKIRKIFTVRNAKDGFNVFVLSFSAPPDEYDSHEASFDAAFQSFRFL
jgi:hypothetical protein